MAATGASVQVIGLKALMKDLSNMSDPRAGVLQKAMAQAGRTAMEPIANTLRASYPTRSGKLRGSVRVTSSRTGAAVRVGRKPIPYAGPVDFGGYPAGRPYLADGRYLYPTARSQITQVINRYELAVHRAVDQYQWTNSTSDPGSVHD